MGEVVVVTMIESSLSKVRQSVTCLQCCTNRSHPYCVVATFVVKYDEHHTMLSLTAVVVVAIVR